MSLRSSPLAPNKPPPASCRFRPDRPLRRTLIEAIFPFYIIHQTIIVVAAYNLNRLHLPVALEAAILLSLTLAGCWLTYVTAKRIPLLRPFFSG